MRRSRLDRRHHHTEDCILLIGIFSDYVHVSAAEKKSPRSWPMAPHLLRPMVSPHLPITTSWRVCDPSASTWASSHWMNLSGGLPKRVRMR